MKDNKIVTPGQVKKKDQTIITSDMEEQCSTTTILEKPITMNRATNRTHEAFGVSNDRVVEILQKLIAVASIYPKYSTIVEVFVNCSDRFTVMERLFGIFIMGTVKGKSTMAKLANIRVKANALTMPLEQRLLSLLSNCVMIEDPFLKNILERGR